MKNEVRPIDANALNLKIREYMSDYNGSPTRLAVCRAVLSMLGDERQTPTLQQTCNQLKPDCKPLTLKQLREIVDKPAYLYIYDTALDSGWHIIKAVTEDKIIFRGWNTVYVPISSLGKCFDLYAYSPAQIDREAWVSAEERLPEPDSGPYWIAKKKNNGEWQMKMALFCDYGYAMPIDAKTDVTWRDFDYTKIVNVSHWMPLPEPPAEPEKRMGVTV